MLNMKEAVAAVAKKPGVPMMYLSLKNAPKVCRAFLLDVDDSLSLPVKVQRQTDAGWIVERLAYSDISGVQA